MNADPRVPSGAPSVSPAPSRRTRRASIQTRGNSTTAFALPSMPHQRRSSLQIQHRDSPDCLCTACHLKAVVFPRRQDGSIILPVPWLLTSGSAGDVGRPAPTTGPGEQSHVPNVVEATRSDDGLQESGRRSEFSARNVRIERNTDRGEGSSRGPGVAPSEEFLSAPMGYLNTLDNPESTRRRSNTDRSRSYRFPKPYSRPADPPPSHAAGREPFQSTYRPGIDSSSVFLYHPSSFATTTQSSVADPYDNPRAGPSHSFDPRVQLGNPSPTASIGRSGFQSSGDPHSTFLTSARGSRTNLHPSNRPLDRPSAPWYPPRNESQPPPSRRFSSSHLQPSSLDRPWAQTRDTPLNTLMRHSQPPTPEYPRVASGTAEPSRRSRFPPPTSAPSSSSFTWRPGEDENAIRFEEPVVYDPTITSDQQDGQMEIKWDTERKRRQGYFSPAEEGSEKSNFRLYSQSKIDFGS